MRTLSIRTHLLLLVLAVSVPLVMAVGYGIYSDRQLTIASTKTSLKILTNIMVSNTGGKINNTRLLLERLAERPIIQKTDPKNCDPILKDIYILHPEYANVDYANKDGVMVCSAVTQPGGKLINISKTTWFQRVLKEKKFIVGKPLFGPITGKWVSVLAMPIFNAQHEITGSVQLPLNLKAYDPNIPAFLLPPSSHYGFFNEDGVLVWRNVDPDHVIGTHPKKDIPERIITLKKGTLESTAADGVTRFYSVLPIPDTGWTAWVGVPITAIYAKANRRAQIATALLLATMLTLLLIALVIARRITKPIAQLERVARAVHGGDLGARAAAEGPPDIAAVALKFNAMVDAQQHSVEQLRIAATAFESHEGMMITDANRIILRVNTAFTRATGYSSEEIVGKTPHILRSDRHDTDFYRAIWQSINRTGGWQGELWGCRKNGEVYPKWLTITAVKDEKDVITHFISTDFDITERKQAEEKINELAFYDQLTGLANRTLLLDHLKQAKSASTRSGLYGALMLIDLDNFKTLNDTFGHDMGDLLLKQVAQRLTECIRSEETVARLGGDEFVVILTNLSIDENEAVTHAETVGEKIILSLNQPYQLRNMAYHSTPSIGLTLFKGSHASHEDLLKQADLAMYKSKEMGRNAMRFFDPAMQTIIVERSALEAGLRNAIQLNQLLLHYQAQVTSEGRITGAEVLVRWQHPERGLVPPGEFIPLAEETGLILSLGRWVLDSACSQLALWADQPGLDALTLSVNVSAHQFSQADFVDQVLAILRKTGANPLLLKLELTESLMVHNIESIIGKMFELKTHGVGFSLDDFGTGYSSLSYLKRMPLELLKIDQSFVHDVLIDPNDAAIARTIVALAQSLGLGVIAEGVETEEQRAFLASSGCHAYQGYLFSRPLPVSGFEEFAKRT